MVTRPYRNGARYDPVAVFFHWMTALLIAAQFVLAWTMPEIERDTRPERLISLHLSLGVLIAVLVLVRFAWRLIQRMPPPDPAIPQWQVLAAAVTHRLLYVLLLALPLMGWANASARGWVIHPFGLFAMPDLVAKGSSAGHLMGDLHAVGSNLLLVLIGVHLFAALFHHFWRRDDTLRRMLPGK